MVDRDLSNPLDLNNRNLTLLHTIYYVYVT